MIELVTGSCLVALELLIVRVFFFSVLMLAQLQKTCLNNGNNNHRTIKLTKTMYTTTTSMPLMGNDK